MSSPWNDLKAVIFDFDGTLAVLNIDFGLMKRRVVDWMKLFGVTEERVRERYLLEIIDEVRALLADEAGPAEADRFYQGAYRILQEVEVEAAARGRMISGAPETLTHLIGKGLKVGIVTRNCAEAVRKVFPGIDACCHAFVSRDSVKRVKPHPEHLTAALKTLESTESETVMVGDHVLDILAGKGVGMRTIGVLTGYIKREAFEEAGADCILNNVVEIRQLVEEGI